MALRTLWTCLALGVLVAAGGCRSTSAYHPTCCRPAVATAVPCCPTPVTTASPVPVAVPAAPAPCCNNPPGGAAVVPVPSAGYGH